MTVSQPLIKAPPRVMSAEAAQAAMAADEVMPVYVGPRGDYERGHLPGAVNVEFGALVDARGCGGGWLPPVDALAKVLAAAGIDGATPLLAADDSGGGRASRLLWTMDALGLAPGVLLDGGMGTWKREGRALERGAQPVTVACTAVMLEAAGADATTDVLADAAWIAGRLDDPEVVVLDNRSTGEYCGDDVRAARGGHIPGAVSYPWRRAVMATPNATDGALRPRDELLGELASLGVSPGHEVVVHCQTHHRSSHTYVLLRWLGFERVRGYAGSWNEWGNDPALPVVTGPSPR